MKRLRSIGKAETSRRGRLRIVDGIRRLIFAIDLVLDVRHERLALSRLDDRALKDIGLSRSDVYAETRRPLWDIPRDRLLIMRDLRNGSKK